MFYGCENLASLKLTGAAWDTSHVVDMNHTFDGCSKLASLDLAGWSTTSATGMEAMFKDCATLASLDLNTWNTSAATMTNMFDGCASLKSIKLGSNWSFIGNGSGCELPTPTSDAKYNGKWRALPGATDPDFPLAANDYVPADLKTSYTGGSADMYVWSTRYYTIIYDTNGGGTVPATQHILTSAPVPLLANTSSITPPSTNTVFYNWNTAAAGTGTSYQNGDTITSIMVPGSTLTLYAQWRAQHTVSFNANGGTGSMPAQVVTNGVVTPLDSMAGLANAPHTLLGWNTAADGSGTSYADGGSISTSADVILYAQWSVTYTFSPNGGLGTQITQESTLSGIVVPANTYTRLGYQPNGWEYCCRRIRCPL